MTDVCHFYCSLIGEEGGTRGRTGSVSISVGL
jgi:hypothetical protein